MSGTRSSRGYALLSVTNKTNLVTVAKGLVNLDYKLMCSGGTAKALIDAGLEVTEVSEVTGMTAMLDGRVKTLHPNIHAAILAKDTESHMDELREARVTPIDIVICNLYAFEKMIGNPDITIEDAIENIDIGGVTLLRAAGKNFSRVIVVCDPGDYDEVLLKIREDDVSLAFRQELALKAFIHTSNYDSQISSYLMETSSLPSGVHRSLRYGMNPHQKPAMVYTTDKKLPFEVLNGSPGFINICDALNGWQLVKELKSSLRRSAAASFKHVSPSGAAVGLPLNKEEEQLYLVDDTHELSKIAIAYCRARGADRMSSFGDFIALSDDCDESAAKIIRQEVSDGIIAPGYTEKALEILSMKKKGTYCILKIDPQYCPENMENRDLFGLTLRQKRNNARIDQQLFDNIVTCDKTMPPDAIMDLIISTIAVKYAQSNSVCLAYRGQVVGLGAGQQSRIHCTKLAADKTDRWWLRHHPKVVGIQFNDGIKRNQKANFIERYIDGTVDEKMIKQFLKATPASLTDKERNDWISKLTDVSLATDGFFPFEDNIDRAAQSGVKFISNPGGSNNDESVIAACNRHGVTMAFTSLRCFHH